MKSFFQKKKFLSILFISTLLCSSYQFAATWVGTNVASVTDDDLVLDGSLGDIILTTSEKVVINAATTDITVTLQNGPIVVRGNDGGPSVLCVCAASGQTVTFEVVSSLDLTFEGSPAPDSSPLLIIVGGEGDVQFNIAGQRTIAFTNDGAGGGGTRVFNYMESPTNNVILSFVRDVALNPTDDARIEIGGSSLMSYIASTTVALGTASERGTILFDPSNENTGRTILNIKDGGGFIVWGHLTNESDKTDIDLTDIDMTVPAGLEARMEIIGNGDPDSAGLLVENENATCFELLFDPYCNLGARDDAVDYNGSFNGMQWGFVLGANASINIEDNAYLDYVGLTNNTCLCLTFTEVPGFPGVAPTTLIKARNQSAFFVDGNNDPLSVPALINIGSLAALVFRSGVNKDGVVEDLDGFDFTISVTNETTGAGEVVFDVEGELNVEGAANEESKIELLSLFVDRTGGPLFVGGSEVIFPLRTFAKDGEGNNRQYNKGAFLINNCMNLFSTGLAHTDEIHNVFQNDDVNSEPSYIGGELYTLKATVATRPRINFFDARLYVNTSLASTGMDWVVPNGQTSPSDETCVANASEFIFYNNGKVIDSGTGRNMILGTFPGSNACDGCSPISLDSHLDVLQKTECPAQATHMLSLSVAQNDDTITEGITGSIANQLGVHSIYLGHASNITVGNQNASIFTDQTMPELLIDGNYFSFETRGGTTNTPSLSNVTGEGGIFVDTNGTFGINPEYRANMNAMVTRSGTGVVNLPKNQVHFGCKIGIADWQLDLMTTQTVVLPGVCLGDYTLNWVAVTKDYAQGFCPYEIGNVNNCVCPPVEADNLINLPTFQGTVQQLQIQDSRFSDPAQFIVDCGVIEELVFCKSLNPAQAPTAFVYLQNKGTVGLGSAHKDVDSLSASVKLGVNGVMVVANGDGCVKLNEDVVIDNVCPFLKGPDFQAGNILRIESDDSRVLRVKSTGALDFRQFDADTDIIQFGGDLVVIFEPGSRMLGAGGTLLVEDEVCIEFGSSKKAQQIYNDIVGQGNGLANTDPFRIRLIGTINIQLGGCSKMLIDRDAVVGVETLLDTAISGTQCMETVTDVCIILNDSAEFNMGDGCEDEGGTLQVGNTTDIPDNVVNFKLRLDSDNAKATIRSEGFLGLGTGVVSKAGSVPNDWLVAPTFNNGAIALEINAGTFDASKSFPGDNPNASLIGVGPGPEFTVSFAGPTAANNPNILGGSNVFLATGAEGTGVNPTVLDDNTATAGILASGCMIDIATLPTGGTGAALVDAMRVYDWSSQNNAYRGKGAVSQKDNPAVGPVTITYVDEGKIGRQDIFDIADVDSNFDKGRARQTAVENGCLSLDIENAGVPPREIGHAQQLPRP